ncbi:hypothetical protein L596_009923 [Steinernema carpocapsae]|uniref:UPAR/Ly6 domain-containing protein n=1 Tax=Steinernema carpocapsae TaxID=34508 RepID=A0A4U5PGR9_STECR|nr:hypothetical protein L596_009923 [Steinernema carpocapsae]
MASKSLFLLILFVSVVFTFKCYQQTADGKRSEKDCSKNGWCAKIIRKQNDDGKEETIEGCGVFCAEKGYGNNVFNDSTLTEATFCCNWNLCNGNGPMALKLALGGISLVIALVLL